MRVAYAFAMAAALLAGASASAAASEDVQALGRDYWAWRATAQPATSDDIPRIVRPAGWTPDWSAEAIAEQRRRLAAFEARLAALPAPTTPEALTDARLMASALARVRWEMEHVAAWRRQPHFYISQALIPIFETLLPPPPVGRERIEQVIRLLDNAPAVLTVGERNLDDMRGPFIDAAIAQIDLVPDSLKGMAKGLESHADAGQRRRIDAGVARALKAFAAYRTFLEAKRAGAGATTAVGRDSYRFFLERVALYPYSPEELLVIGRQEWARAVQFETIERNRNAARPELPIGESIGAVTARLNADERKVRDFLRDQKLLTVPDWAGHYNAMGFPAYLAPIGWLGRTFDLTDRMRTGRNATVYLPEPSPKLGYFNQSITRDPRPIIVHEGVPGHFFQLTLGWRHPNRLRRHYYDSGANEGTGFYAEEMMLQAGLFDDSPKTREMIYNFARLRALRVEVDVKLALGEFTIEEAAAYLERTVPMDRATAEEEAVFFAAQPGQAISYQIGKTQTLEFLANARRALGDRFELRHFHDFLWLNGNVPIAVQQDEYLALHGAKGSE